MKGLKISWIVLYVLTGLSLLVSGILFFGYLETAKAAEEAGKTIGNIFLAIIMPIFSLGAGGIFLLAAITINIIWAAIRNKRKKIEG